MAVIGVDEQTNQPVIRVGSQVRVKDSFGEETFLIVNDEVSDPGRRRISEASPMATALLGHRFGDVVTVRAPYGVRSVTVLGVDATSEV